MKLLKFEASWCEPCKQLSKVLETMELPWPICPIDIDKNRDAAIEYGIRGVPTMILMDENDNIIKKVTGALSKSQIIEEFELGESN
jgi:thioredoxin 1